MRASAVEASFLQGAALELTSVKASRADWKLLCHYRACATIREIAQPGFDFRSLSHSKLLIATNSGQGCERSSPRKGFARTSKNH